jgi:acetyl esterase/lipase
VHKTLTVCTSYLPISLPIYLLPSIPSSTNLVVVSRDQHFMSTIGAVRQDATAASSIQVTHRTDKSLLMHILQLIVKPIASQLLKQKEPLPAGSPQLTVPKSRRKHCNITEHKEQDIHIYDISAKHHTTTSPAARTSSTEKTHPKKRIYYFAGSGWRAPASGEHWALLAELARRLPNTTISLISYPLAPHSAASTAFPQLQNLYASLLTSSKAASEIVILAGDSAGGNIALALTLAAVTADPDALMPDALMLISPSVDCRRSNPDIQKVAPHDPILRVPFVNSTAKGWRGDWEASDPRVSPLLVSDEVMKAFAARRVPVYGVTGTYDILAPDAVLFRERCGRNGVEGKWLEWDGQMHVFPLIWRYGVREGRQGKDWIVEVLKSC